MYILKNALINIGRNRGRNILMSCIIFAIIATTVVALIIHNTSDAIIQNYKDKFSSEVSISPDMQKLREQAMANASGGMVRLMRPELSAEQQLAFTASQYLKESIATGSVGAGSEDITAIDHQEAEDDDASANGGPGFVQGGGGMALNIVDASGDFRLLGDSWTEFGDGDRALLDDGISRMPDGLNECLISEDLAETNGVKVGDTAAFTASVNMSYNADDYPDAAEGDAITLNGIEYTVRSADMGMASRDVTYTMTVVGIYTDLTDEYPEGMQGMTVAGMNRRNEVLTTLDTLLESRLPDETGVMVDVTYYLQSPDLLDEFETDVRSMGLGDDFLVSTDSESYDTIVKPVEGLKGISMTFMLVVVILGGIILILLATISIRERKYEIGVLRAMGMKRSRVALGLWSEILMITCLCLVLGMTVGVIAAQPVADVLIQQQSAGAEEDGNPFGGQGMPGGGMMTSRNMGGRIISGGNFTDAQPLEDITLSVDLVTVLEIIGISLLLASIAGLVSVTKITQYEPIKILMERN